MAAASPSPNAAATVYRIGALEDFAGINPFSAWSGPSWECFRKGYNFLTRYDQEHKPVPDLARSWDTSADGRTWTFHIIEGMVDGVLSGHGFLGAKHTRRYIRSEFVAPLLSYRGGLNEWLASGRGGVVDLAGEKVADIVGREPVGLPDGLLEALCGLIATCAAETGAHEYPDPRCARAVD